MGRKYCDMISKIKAEDGFKRDLVVLMEEKRQAQTRRSNGRYFSMKQNRKKWPALVAAALAVLTCTGAALAVLYTGFGAKNDGVQFSDNYPQYLEKLDQRTAGDGVQVALESYLCDEGFLDLQFRVKIGEEKLEAFREGKDANWEEPLTYLSFNDPVMEKNGVRSLRLGGANYTLNIDGQDIWLRGRTARSVEKVGVGEYVVQQMWFLGEDVLEGKDEFRISLKDVAVGLGEDCIPMEGDFDLTVSTAKAAASTVTVEMKDNVWSPREGVTKTVEKVSQTPLQTIFRIRSVYTGISSEEMNIDSWDYLVYDAAGQARATYSARVAAEITYADGTVERLAEPGEYDLSRSSFEGATFITEEIVAVAPMEGAVALRAYESEYAPDYRMTVAAEYRIDLSAGTVEAETVNAVIYDAGTGEMDNEYGVYYKLRYGQDVSEVLGIRDPLGEWWLEGGDLSSELD